MASNSALLEGSQHPYQADAAVESTLITRPLSRSDVQVIILNLYYFLMLCFTIWLLFDTWSNKLTIPQFLGVSTEALEEEILRTINFAVVGGFMGSILYHIRQLYYYYTRGKYDSRWFGKYITAPLEGAILSMVVLALVRGGASLFTGSAGTEVTGATNFTVFGTGALVGFSTRDVIGWLEQLAQTRFKAPAASSKAEDTAKDDGQK